MNIFEADFNSNSMKESDQSFNKGAFPTFNHMFNTNSFFGHNPEENTGSYDPFTAREISSDLPNSNFDSSFLNKDSPSESSFFTNHSNLFEDQPKSWNQQWSNGDPVDTYTYHSLPTSTCFGLPDNQNSLISSSPGQSRIMGYLNNTPPLSTPPSTISPTHNIESMKVRDFLNHPSGSLTNLEPSSSSAGPTQTAPNGKEELVVYQRESSESFFTDFFTPNFQSMSIDDGKKLSSESVESDNQPINVWDSLNTIDLNVGLSTSAPSNLPSKNAWSKPLKFERSTNAIKKSKSSSTAQQFKKQSPPPPYLDQRQRIPEPVPEPVVTACVGKKVSELDDFDYSMPKRSVITNVRPGGFQVVCNKKSKSNKPVNKMPSQPPAGVEKCNYGGRCLFGMECSRWHSPDDHEEFNKQKLPNGSRKCPWGVKCFRKLKCINFHSKEELEQFKQQ